jgi:hypothetical protein
MDPMAMAPSMSMLSLAFGGGMMLFAGTNKAIQEGKAANAAAAEAVGLDANANADSKNANADSKNANAGSKNGPSSKKDDAALADGSTPSSSKDGAGLSNNADAGGTKDPSSLKKNEVTKNSGAVMDAYRSHVRTDPGGLHLAKTATLSSLPGKLLKFSDLAAAPPPGAAVVAPTKAPAPPTEAAAAVNSMAAALVNAADGVGAPPAQAAGPPHGAQTEKDLRDSKEDGQTQQASTAAPDMGQPEAQPSPADPPAGMAGLKKRFGDLKDKFAAAVQSNKVEPQHGGARPVSTLMRALKRRYIGSKATQR